MELKNIHNRKEYSKVYEFIGGDKGGVGDHDGFANNAKLKDTVLGKLMNGLFKGIGWLWRKSKEFFVINKLNAQLVNELMRGVVVFCLANNIDLKTGQQISGTTVASDLGHASGTTVADEDNISKMTREELNKRIAEIKAEDADDKKRLVEIVKEKKIIEEELKKETKPSVITAKKQQYQALIDEQNNINKKAEEYRELIEKLEKQLASLGAEPPIPGKFEIIEKNCVEKYGYNEKTGPTNDIPGDYSIIGNKVRSLIAYKEKINIDENKIRKNNQFKIIDTDGTLKLIKISRVDTDKMSVFYSDGTNEKQVGSKFLLPTNFPDIVNMKKKCSNFLEKSIGEYENSPEIDKERLETIYMQYKLIDGIYNASKVKEKIKESVENDNLDMLLEADAVVKMDEPKAGAVGLDKSIGQAAGVVSATVGDILTTRDKQKYKEHEEEFALDIHDVNLAEIEKRVDEMSQSDPEVKAKVSGYVNAYNLKGIQIAAEQLMAPKKDKEGGTQDNSALRMRWNKEVNKTYASFTYIMDITKVEITKEDFGSGLNNSKANKIGEGYAASTESQQKDAIVLNKLPLEEERINYSKMKTGYWCYYSFMYNLKDFRTSIAPVSAAFDKFGLFNITSCFSDVKDESGNCSIIENANFLPNFKVSKPNDNNITLPTDPKKLKIYFIFKHDQRFPDSNKTQSMKVFVLNEYIINGVSQLFLRKKSSTTGFALTENLMNSMKKEEFIFDTKTITCKNFSNDATLLNPWKTALHLDAEHEFIASKSPDFLNTNKVLLEKLSKLLKD